MIIPSYARYDYCNKKACEFLETYGITNFPVDVEKIIHHNKWGLVKYSELMEHFHCDRAKIVYCLRSKDGFTEWDGINYTIAYNDDNRLGDRTRFTLMHEIGHIYLKHLIDFDATQLYRGSLTKSENRVLENEANAFARNVLIPTSMLQHLSNKNICNITYRFGVTPSAARTRLNFYEVDIDINKQLNLSNRLLKIFHIYYYKKLCPICNYHTVSRTAHYCPICGHDSMIWGEGKMIYAEIDSYENGKVKQCPRCKNEDTRKNGEYCQICGSLLVNHCSNNECSYDSLPTNARYCPQCGCESTFFRSGFLKAWDCKENEEEFENIPDEIEETLPFA